MIADKFPIRVLSEMTGVAPTTLRAWERRYGLLKPLRTPKGHRLYTQEHAKLVKQVVGLLNDNYTISKAINEIRLNEARKNTQGFSSTTVVDDPSNHWELFIKRFITAIELFDENKLEAAYNEALSLYPIDTVTLNLLRPLLKRLGENWQNRPAGIAEEHFFSAFLRNKVGARMHHASSHTQGRRLLMACLPGEYHELGILLFALSAMSRGYRILFLGSNLPINQIMPVVNTVAVDAVILSGSAEVLDSALTQDLQQLQNNLPIPLMLGGDVSKQATESGLHDIFVLGNDYLHALTTLEQWVPAYQPI